MWFTQTRSQQTARYFTLEKGTSGALSEARSST
jgi:hypothetical protein